MQTATRYATEKTEHGLLVRGVVLAVTGDTGRGFSLAREDFQKFKQTFDRRVSREFIGAFVRLGHSGPRIGKIVALEGGDELRGDLLIENADVAARIEADAITDLSITFARQAGALVDVSLLEDTFGQLHEKLPPFKVDVRKEFEIEPDALVALSLSEPEQNMDKLDKALELLTKMDERLTKLETTKPEPKGDDDILGDADEQQRFEKAYGDKIKEIESRERERDVDSKVTQLSAIAGGATAKQKALWREKLVECKTSDLLSERFERMREQLEMRRSSKTTLEPEGGYAHLSIESQLKEEFVALGGIEKLGVSEQEYINRTKALAGDLR